MSSSAEPQDLVVADDVVWLRVDDESSPGTVRRHVTELSARLGFDESRIGETAIVASELATNLVKYAQDGQVVLRLLRRGTTGGLQVIALDSGPGIRNLSAMFGDGESSSGTLGIGLGAVSRLASSHDAYSLPGSGTVVVATFWQDGSTPSEPFAGLTRAIAGEEECGDAYAVRRTEHGYLLMLCDGLGHGTLAAHASREAVRIFRSSTDSSPATLLARIDAGLVGSRGAAIAIGHVEPERGQLTYAGVGNVAGRIEGGGRSHGLVSMPGIVGHRMRPGRDTVYDVPAAAVVVMHSDGLTQRWELSSYPGLPERTPLVIAATLMRDAAVRHDDAGVLVLGGGQP
jgi:anti-sigma regulatory factor (Ser/Thr protein kinase)